MDRVTRPGFRAALVTDAGLERLFCFGYPAGMARRIDPIRVYAAQRAGMTRRLVEAFGLSEERAETLMSAWEREAERCGVRRLEPGFWTTGEVWMLEGRR